VHARQVPEQEARAELYDQILQRVHDALPALPVAHNSSVHATTAAVEGFQPSPLGPALPALNNVSKN